MKSLPRETSKVYPAFSEFTALKGFKIRSLQLSCMADC